MPTSNTEELGRFLKCTVIGRGVFGPCACCTAQILIVMTSQDILKDHVVLLTKTKAL